MNEKQIACLLLVLVIAGFFFGTHRSYQALTKMQKAAEEAREKAVMAEAAAVQARRGLEMLQTSTRELRDFADAWKPCVAEVESPQATEQRVIDLIKQAEVFAVAQRFELLEQKKEPLVKRRLRAHITVEDDYAKALNWMAGVESAMPLCRVASCRLSRGDSGNDIRLELILDFPIIADSLAG